MRVLRRFFSRPTYRSSDIAPEDIFLDSSNLPVRDDARLEGRVVRPLSKKPLMFLSLLFLGLLLFFTGKVVELQIVDGAAYAEASRTNRLEHSIIFAARGNVEDRNGELLAWNTLATSTPNTGDSGESSFPRRAYSERNGFSLLLGFVRYPKADSSGAWWRTETAGVSGIERTFEEILRGHNGTHMIETDALGDRQNLSVVEPPVHGDHLRLTIDAAVQEKLFETLSRHARAQRFLGGAGVILDVQTGEVLALVSFPEGAEEKGADDQEHASFLNRAISGLYTPGSIVKPLFAAAALEEGVISAEKKILSVGAITIPNPYDPEKPSVFRDWTVHGPVDMREAIAVSSDEYFYQVGGGYKGQKGLGIEKIDAYARLFGLGSTTGIMLLGEAEGIIPTPEWKEKVFGPNDPWRIGNTYHTSIGQFGFQVTPIEMAVAIGAIANGGKRMTPQLRLGSTPSSIPIDITPEHLIVAREGMRLAVTSSRSDATAKSLLIPGFPIAVKTGTAEVGARKEFMHSWSVGFWPVEKPRYAYAVVLERAPAGTLSGATPALRSFFDWLIAEKREYAFPHE
jgi:penicillin-binding protein 2